MTIRKSIGASVRRLIPTNLTWLVVATSSGTTCGRYSCTSAVIGESHDEAAQVRRCLVLLPRSHLCLSVCLSVCCCVDFVLSMCFCYHYKNENEKETLAWLYSILHVYRKIYYERLPFICNAFRIPNRTRSATRSKNLGTDLDYTKNWCLFADDLIFFNVKKKKKQLIYMIKILNN